MKNVAKNNYAENPGEKMETVGDRLLIFINKTGLSRSDIAKEADVVFSTVSNYLDKDELPGPKFLSHLVRKHRLNVDWLLSGSGPMTLAEIEAMCQGVAAPGPDPGDQVVELKHRLAEQILAGVELRDRQSRWLSKALEAVAKAVRAYGMTQEQHRAIMDAVLDPEQAMEQLSALEAAQSHQSAVGD